MSLPRNVRKLTIGEEVWGWKVGGFFTAIWKPDRTRVDIKTTELGVGWDEEYGIQGTVYPGAVREYIEQNFMEKAPEYVVETPEIGKLYVYRHVNVAQGSSIQIMSLKGGDYEARERYNMLFKFLADKSRLLLVSFRTNVEEKTAFAKFLVADTMLELKIQHPRTFRGSFIAHEEWSKFESEDE